jgi:hypothetical protein
VFAISRTEFSDFAAQIFGLTAEGLLRDQTHGSSIQDRGGTASAPSANFS